MSPTESPLVSVIIAAYGRPNVLRHAIASVLAQTLEDFEVLVVGDAAGPETEAIVSGFGDPRLRFTDLAMNYGEQSGPNNVGAARARGTYLAFINQDDIWFSDHLHVALGWLEASCSDLVIGHGAVIQPSSTEGLGYGSAWTCILTADNVDGRYDPILTIAPASTWLLRRELHESLRGWRPAKELRGESSRDFLLRAWRSGARIRVFPRVSSILIQSGARPNSYLDRNSPEHDHFSSALANDETELRRLLLDRAWTPPRAKGSKRLSQSMQRAAVRLGLHPLATSLQKMREFGKGQQIARLRKDRGLPPALGFGATLDDLRIAGPHRTDRCLEPGADISFGREGEGHQVRLRGWHPPCAKYCDTADETAELLLPLSGSASKRLQLRVTGDLLGADFVDVAVGETVIARWHPAEGESVWSVDLECDALSRKPAYLVVTFTLATKPAARLAWFGQARAAPAMRVRSISLRNPVP